MSREPVALALYWHHCHPEVDSAQLASLAPRAVLPCLAAPGPHAGDRPLVSLETVEINFVDDRTIARVHADHLGDPTPTDVITFPHGEVFISIDTAVRAAPTYGEPAWRETLRYLVHALLHLNGHHDTDPSERAVMHAEQEKIVRALAP